MSASMISIVVPIYRNADSLRELVRRVHDTLATNGQTYELLLIDDGSPDKAWDVIRELAETFDSVKGIRLSRNFGQHPAIAAGFARAKGDIIVLMDGDLEDRPEDLPALLEKLGPDVDIVYSIKNRADRDATTSFTSRLFHRLISRTLRHPVPDGIGTYRAFKRHVLEGINSFPEYHIMFGPLMFFVGFRSVYIYIESGLRQHGRSSYSFVRRLSLALNAIATYTDFPVRLLFIFGLGILACTSIYAAIILIQFFFFNVKLPSGLTIIAMLNIGFGSSILIGLSVIGGYVFRVYQEVLRRPRYLVMDHCNFDTSADRHPTAQAL